MSRHNSLARINTSFATPMTREGVNSPALLSPEGSEAHYKRRGGPGTRSKNPNRFDKNAHLGKAFRDKARKARG